MSQKRILYWVSRAPRVHDNPALITAQRIAMEKQLPLEVLFNVYPKFPFANERNMHFLLSGVDEFAQKLKPYNIPFHLRFGNVVEQLEHLHREQAIDTLITEHQVLRPLRNTHALVDALAQRLSIEFKRVNTACVVPVDVASPKLEFAARTFRPKILKLYHRYLDPLPALHPHPFPAQHAPTLSSTWVEEALLNHPHWKRLSRSHLKPGEDAALAQLAYFIKHGLCNYDRRNQVDAQGQSYLSAYLHFGFLAPTRMIRAVEASAHPNAVLFVEEAMVRRELAENYCYYCKDYDNFNGAWPWAKATLNRHREDPRPYLYTRDQLEHAQTHDALWNYCQQRVVEDGYLHSYLRMYWAKMVLLWTASPEEALGHLIHLNDTYFLDGRDPNGYTGIQWSITGVHDRAWFEKPIHGLIRPMGAAGTLKKSKLKL
jgi:deoxyribodipyrimidine photo-lyase